jgi:hypothetical protein
MRTTLTLLVLMASLLVGSAGTPKTFEQLDTIQWITLEVRDGMDVERVWNSVVDILINDFELDLVAKDTGYLRTEWLYSYGGKYKNEYRVRVIIRVAPDGKTIRVKTEAQVKVGLNWLIGVDSRLVSTLKTDLMGTIGRTTR